MTRLDGLANVDPDLYGKGVHLIRLLLESALKVLRGEEADLREVIASAGVEVEELSALLKALFD